MFYLQNQLPKVGRHLLIHSLEEKGQRKKIIDDHDRLYSEIEISQLLSNNRLFANHRCKLHKYTIDVYTIFLAVISAKEFFVFFV
jgi:hypothetical protein